MTIDDAREQAAREYATAKHRDQRYGDKPYTVHLAAVREVLRDFGYGDGHMLSVAAWLHDVIEDTDATRADVAARFGEGVAALVWAVTGVGVNRKARNEDAYSKIREAAARFLPAGTLKLADRIANAEASKDDPAKLAMYRKEQASFRQGLANGGLPSMWRRLEAALA